MGEFPSKHLVGNTSTATAQGRKGGEKRSIGKKYAAQLRELKKKGNTNEQVKFFVQRLEDPEANILHIQKQIDEFIAANPKEHNKIAALNTSIQLHKAHYGEKSTNLNLNVNTSIEEWERRLSEE